MSFLNIAIVKPFAKAFGTGKAKGQEIASQTTAPLKGLESSSFARTRRQSLVRFSQSLMGRAPRGRMVHRGSVVEDNLRQFVQAHEVRKATSSPCLHPELGETFKVTAKMGDAVAKRCATPTSESEHTFVPSEGSVTPLSSLSRSSTYKKEQEEVTVTDVTVDDSREPTAPEWLADETTIRLVSKTDSQSDDFYDPIVAGFSSFIPLHAAIAEEHEGF